MRGKYKNYCAGNSFDQTNLFSPVSEEDSTYFTTAICQFSDREFIHF